MHQGLNSLSGVFLPEVHSLNPIMRKQQMDPHRGTFYKTTAVLSNNAKVTGAGGWCSTRDTSETPTVLCWNAEVQVPAWFQL